jgi:hypothetical protein
MPQQVVGGGEIEVQLTHERRVEWHGLEFDDHVAAQRQVVEEQIEVEVLLADLQVDLSPDKSEARAKLEQELLHVGEQSRLDRAFVGVVAQVQEVEDIGVLGDLLSQIGLRGRQGRLKIAHRSALSEVKCRIDLQGQDIPRPAVLDGPGRVPEAGFGIPHLI